MPKSHLQRFCSLFGTKVKVTKVDPSFQHTLITDVAANTMGLEIHSHSSHQNKHSAGINCVIADKTIF